MSPENEARLSVALDQIEIEQQKKEAGPEPEIYFLHEISLDEARIELARAEGRLRTAIFTFGNKETLPRDVRDLYSRQMSDARREVLLAAWRLRALEAEQKISQLRTMSS